MGWAQPLHAPCLPWAAAGLPHLGARVRVYLHATATGRPPLGPSPSPVAFCLAGNVYKFQTGSRFHAILWHKHLDDACKSNRPQVKSPRSSLPPEGPSPPSLGATRRSSSLDQAFPGRQGPSCSAWTKPGFRPELGIWSFSCPLKETPRECLPGTGGRRAWYHPKVRGTASYLDRAPRVHSWENSKPTNRLPAPHNP